MTHASVVSEGEEQVEISGEGLGKACNVCCVVLVTEHCCAVTIALSRAQFQPAAGLQWIHANQSQSSVKRAHESSHIFL